MSILSTAISGFSKGEVRHIESLNIDVNVGKMTVKQAKELQAFQNSHNLNPQDDEQDLSKNTPIIEFILKKFFTDMDGNPLMSDGEEGLLDEMPVEAIKEISEMFGDVNGIADMTDEQLQDAVKKK